MPPESQAAVDLTLRAEPASLPEWMDEPCSYEEFRACLVDLTQVNRLSLGYRPTLDFLERLNIAPESRTPLRIVDVGSGGGDLLRRIERWAHHKRLNVMLTGIDLNPYAACAARELTTKSSAIQWVTGDAFSYDQPIDIVLSSLFTHHLSSREIARFLAWSERVAMRGWFVNDLCREERPYRLFGLLSRVMGWHHFIRHDGPVSFRRSFREEDWQRLAATAGIPDGAIVLQRWRPGRLCVERLK
jgi:SAM-dependent methyltransferase